MSPNTNLFMKSKGLVSFVIPTYNRLGMLKKRIDEIRQQIYTDCEIIVVDDCSTDGTWEWLESQDVIKIRLGENSHSVSIPRGIGITHSHGEFIAPTDDDVVVLPDKAKWLVEAIERDDAVLAYGNRRESVNGQERPTPSLLKDWNPLLPEGWGVDNGQFIYRSNVYDKVPIRFPKRACDWELAKQIKALGRFVWIESPVCIYNIHSENRSARDSTKTADIYPEKFLKYFREGYIIDTSQ